MAAKDACTGGSRRPCHEQKMPAPGSEFDRLLLEGWRRCADDDELRASPAYCGVRRLLTELSSCASRCDADQLARLERLVCAMRTSDYEDLALLLDLPEQPARRPEPPAPADVAKWSPDCAVLTALAYFRPRSGTSRFLSDVALHSCDRGEVLGRVTRAVLADFRTFADTVLAVRVTQTGTALARELTTARVQYDALARRSVNRALLTVAHLNDVMPTFDWRRYASESDYLRRVAVRARPGCVMRSDDDEADNARGQRLLYRLDWLRSEIDRATADSQCLYEQHAVLAAELAAINGDVASEQCAAADRVSRASRELDELRARSAEQVCAVDRLMVAVQLATENRVAEEEECRPKEPATVDPAAEC